MKAYLRHTKTGLFYCGWHNWTMDAEHATDFETVARAAQRAHEERLPSVEILTREQDSSPFEVIPIEPLS